MPNVNLSLAIDLDRAAKLVPKELSDKMRQAAAGIDQRYLESKASKAYPFKELKDWGGGYSDGTRAYVGVICYERYRQVGLEGFKDLVLQEARSYLNKTPDTSLMLYPGAIADGIFLETAAFRLTGEVIYLEKANQMAVATFFDGDSGLPRATNRHDHYEAITRGDTLAMALLDLWAAKVKPKMDLGMIYTDR